MIRMFTRDVGRYKANTISGDWPPATWRQIEQNTKMKMDKFSVPIAPGLSLGAEPPRGKAKQPTA